MTRPEPLSAVLSSPRAAGQVAGALRRGILRAQVASQDFDGLKRVLGLPRNAFGEVLSDGSLRVGAVTVKRDGTFAHQGAVDEHLV